MKVETIAADQVKPGDRIYNKYGYCAAAKWVEVREVKFNGTGRVELVTGHYSEWKVLGEGIAVVKAGEAI